MKGNRTTHFGDVFFIIFAMFEGPLGIHLNLENFREFFISKFRGHPGLNQGPLDLQSNALPLSYTLYTETTETTAYLKQLFK